MESFDCCETKGTKSMLNSLRLSPQARLFFSRRVTYTKLRLTRVGIKTANQIYCEQQLG